MSYNFLMDFNASITQAAAKTMKHLSDFVFISMGNITLARRDAYLSHLRTGIKPDTLNELRTGPLYISTLFPDSVIRKGLKKTLLTSSPKDTQVLHVARVGITHMNGRTRGRTADLKQSQRDRPGRI